MLSFAFEDQGTHKFLVYTVGESDVLDSMNFGQLTNNNTIPGLAPIHINHMDGIEYIKYDVSAKLSLKQLIKKEMFNKKKLIAVFKGIIDAILSAEEYMIALNTLLWDIDYVFVNVATYEISLICLPYVPMDWRENNKKSYIENCTDFFKYILDNTQFDKSEKRDYVLDIRDELMSKPDFSLTDFRKKLENFDSTSEPHHGRLPKLIYSKNGVEAEVNKSPFVIGRSEDSDFVIAVGNISRQHARIICEDGKYYIIDYWKDEKDVEPGKKRGPTYVNDDLIERETKVEIRDGDKLMFSDEKFSFVFK